jgi:hypothetical protein
MSANQNKGIDNQEQNFNVDNCIEGFREFAPVGANYVAIADLAHDAVQDNTKLFVPALDIAIVAAEVAPPSVIISVPYFAYNMYENVAKETQNYQTALTETTHGIAENGELVCYAIDEAGQKIHQFENHLHELLPFNETNSSAQKEQQPTEKTYHEPELHSFYAYQPPEPAGHDLEQGIDL